MAAQQRPADVPANANAECVGPASEQAGKAASCEGCPNKEACATGKNKPNAGSSDIAERLSAVKHKILVLSGKGGVGKSTFSAQLAWALADAKKKTAGADGGEPFQVGIMDIDICGPSVPKMMRVEKEEVRKTGSGWDLVWAADNLGVMSVGFMLGSPDDAIIWRGPRKDGLIRQFLADVEWGALDFLIVDAPPGTSDEHISIATYLKANGGVDGAVIVTTPQEVSLMDVRKELNFCRKVGIPVLGVVENMSGFACPNCAHRTDIFAPAKGGAAQMSADFKVPFLGAIPLDTQLLSACEEGVSYLSTRAAAPARQPFISVVQTLMKNPRLADTWNGATFPEPTPAPASATAATKPRTNSVDVEMGGVAAPSAAPAAAAAAPASAAVTPAAAQQQIAALTAANAELQKQLAAAMAQLNALRAAGATK